MCGCICKLFHNITVNLCPADTCLVKVLEVLCAGYLRSGPLICFLFISEVLSSLLLLSRSLTTFPPQFMLFHSCINLVLFISSTEFMTKPVEPDAGHTKTYQ